MISSLFMLLSFVIALALVLFAAFYIYCQYQFTYWKRRGVYTLKPVFPYGNIKDSLTIQEEFGITMKKIYDELKASGHKHVGFYFGWRPTYLATDPEFFKTIMTKDFHHFVDRGAFVDEENDPLSAHLFNLEGQKWKLLRQKLTPTFTSGKMKMMFQTLLACGDELIKEMEKKVSAAEPVEIKDLMARFTTDVIGSCAFGIECNSLKNPNIDFRKYGRQLFEPKLVDQIKTFISLMSPDLFRKLGIRVTNAEVTKFYTRVVKQTVDYREQNNISRKDFMHLLIQLKNHGALAEEDGKKIESSKNLENLTMDQVVAQAFLFFIAGFETSATTLQFALYELAVNEDIQDRLRKDVLTCLQKHDGQLTYDGLQEIKYLDQVVSETLRIFPPVSVLTRVCTENYRIPDSDLVLEKGTSVFLPNYALQMNPEYFPNPEKFDPERFTEEEKLKRHPYTWLPFGEGPRNCIGMRFGLMQTKTAIALLISKYRISLNPKTKTPFKMDPKLFVFSPIGGIWLDFKKL